MSGGEQASYQYDPFNRCTDRAVGSETRETVWSGWQAIEEYKNGALASRRTYGLGLDEIVQLENDLDGDGTPETSYAPLYDSTGNVIALTGEGGKPVERYLYDPYGKQTILVDSLPPVVEQVRAKDGALWLEISEEIDSAALTAAVTAGQLTLTPAGGGTPITVTAAQPVQEGLQAHRRVVLTPETPPASGNSVELVIQPEALVDSFLNRPVVFELTFDWPAGDAVLQDTVPPRVEQVLVREGHIEVELSEEPDLTAASAALQVNGQSVTWTLGDDRYTLKSVPAYQPGTYPLTLSTAALDLAGLGLEEAFQEDVTVSSGLLLSVVSRRPEPRQVPVSAAGNPFGFQGLPLDGETGFLYVRNRYYDPEMGRFISVDPLGYVDGPNLYGFAINDPVNGSDPFGLTAADPELLEILELIQKAANAAARKFGLKSIEEVEKHGDLGTVVHAEMQSLLGPGGKFHHPRILTEVEVAPNGIIFDYGTKKFAGRDSVVKDIIILKKGMTAKNVKVGRTLAKRVTQIVLDLKLGTGGAPMRQADTWTRFGVKALRLVPFRSLRKEFAAVLKDLNLLSRINRYGRYVPGVLIGALTLTMTAQDVEAAFNAGDPERAIVVMIGVDWVGGTGNQLESTLKKKIESITPFRTQTEQMIEELEAQE